MLSEYTYFIECMYSNIEQKNSVIDYVTLITQV